MLCSRKSMVRAKTISPSSDSSDDTCKYTGHQGQHIGFWQLLLALKAHASLRTNARTRQSLCAGIHKFG